MRASLFRSAARRAAALAHWPLSVDDLGLGLRIDASSETIVHAPEFLAPKGFGVSIEAGPVHGGGFLASRAEPGHPDWTRYDGALTLRLGSVEVAAFAVLTERPGGFSFVAVMSAQIIPPIELGLLFTLNGVGGLIGAEVTANTDAMARSVGTGAISRLLFPDDPGRTRRRPHHPRHVGCVLPATAGRLRDRPDAQTRSGAPGFVCHR